MASRTRKSPALPVKQNATAVSYIRELPGAVFFSDLADEDIEYARRLIDAGVGAELLVVAGAYHGFDGLVPNASVSKSFTLSRYNGLARAFGVKELDTLPPG